MIDLGKNSQANEDQMIPFQFISSDDKNIKYFDFSIVLSIKLHMERRQHSL